MAAHDSDRMIEFSDLSDDGHFHGPGPTGNDSDSDNGNNGRNNNDDARPSEPPPPFRSRTTPFRGRDRSPTARDGGGGGLFGRAPDPERPPLTPPSTRAPFAPSGPSDSWVYRDRDTYNRYEHIYSDPPPYPSSGGPSFLDASSPPMPYKRPRRRPAKRARFDIYADDDDDDDDFELDRGPRPPLFGARAQARRRREERESIYPPRRDPLSSDEPYDSPGWSSYEPVRNVYAPAGARRGG